MAVAALILWVSKAAAFAGGHVPLTHVRAFCAALAAAAHMAPSTAAADFHPARSTPGATIRP